MTDFKELREALDAQAAHPEFEWGLWAIYPEMFVPDALDPTDIAYIAAANPAVIRSMLDRLEAAERDAERWRTFIGLGYEIRAAWAANLSLAPVLTSWVDAAMKEQQP